MRGVQRSSELYRGGGWAAATLEHVRLATPQTHGAGDVRVGTGRHELLDNLNAGERDEEGRLPCLRRAGRAGRAVRRARRRS